MCGISLLIADREEEEAEEGLDAAVEEAPVRRGPDAQGHWRWEGEGCGVRALLCCSVLHMRGEHLQEQPLVMATEEEGQLVMGFNGEVYCWGDGQAVGDCDTEALWLLVREAEAGGGGEVRDMARQLCAACARCCGSYALLVLRVVRGELWVMLARDPLGRRSLMCARRKSQHQHPGQSGARLLVLSSLGHPVHRQLLDPEGVALHEVEPLGVYWYRFAGGELLEEGCEAFEDLSPAQRQQSPALRALVPWGKSRDAGGSPKGGKEEEELVTQFVEHLSRAVERRVQCLCDAHAPHAADISNVAILFSGGVDSTALAVMAHQVVAPGLAIDLLNVSFGVCAEEFEAAPDRVTGRSTLEELTSAFPDRTWRFVAVNVAPDEVSQAREHLLAVLHPLHTVMDFNIGAALWFASRGRGFLRDGTPCQSTARVLLSGAGADEQLAGYARHVTACKRGCELAERSPAQAASSSAPCLSTSLPSPSSSSPLPWDALLRQELDKDMGRLWIRNMGRDDRCVSDHGKEVRHPFLDEDFMLFVKTLPLSMLACPDPPEAGMSTKIVLRKALQSLGLGPCTRLDKRAIQFGSRIAKLHRERGGEGAGRKQKGHHSAVL